MKVKISYEWWRTDHKKVPENVKYQLEETAENRIRQQKQEGFIAGELLEEIDNVSYRGWWEGKEIRK